MNIGIRLKEERDRLGYDQEGFAAVGGASRHSQIDWEKGKSFPNAKFRCSGYKIVEKFVVFNLELFEQRFDLCNRQRKQWGCFVQHVYPAASV